MLTIARSSPVWESPFGASSLVDVLRERADRQGDQVLYTFLADGVNESATLTYEQLDRWAKAIAASLQEHGAPGDRVILALPLGLGFIAAFFGCLYSARVAVPAYPPQLRRPELELPRLRSIVLDSGSSLLLTTLPIAACLKPLMEEAPEFAHLAALVIEQASLNAVDDWRPPAIDPDDLAFLQYTSGSTGTPKGVMVSHGNLMHNEEMIKHAFGHQDDRHTVVSWLPLYHDMGLIGTTLHPLYQGLHGVLMPPAAFLQGPVRWLQAISRYRGRSCGGPNFGYEWCVRKIKPEQCEGLDLSSWKVAFNGAEPVRNATMQAFADKFAPYGFRNEAFYPCYGLAEVTLLGTGVEPHGGPTVCHVDAKALQEGRAVFTPQAPGSVALASSGRAWLDRQVAIVDPESCIRCSTDTVGEIWLAGLDVAQGYWNRSEQTRETFRAHLADTGQGPFLRTGDLGFLHDGQLFVTGRLKDLIILDGRNYYPQDIELTVERSHPGIRPASSAAFSTELGSEEVVVVVAEVEREYSSGAADVDGTRALQEIARAVWTAVVRQNGLQPFEVVLLRLGSVPKTTSGKIRRGTCRTAYLQNSLEKVLYRQRRRHAEQIGEAKHGNQER